MHYPLTDSSNRLKYDRDDHAISWLHSLDRFSVLHVSMIMAVKHHGPISHHRDCYYVIQESAISIRHLARTLLAGIVKRRGGCCAPPLNPSRRLVFWWIPILGLRYVSVIQVGPSAEPFIQSLQSRLNLIRFINQDRYLL